MLRIQIDVDAQSNNDSCGNNEFKLKLHLARQSLSIPDTFRSRRATLCAMKEINHIKALCYRNSQNYISHLLRGVCQPLPWASVHWLVQCTLECHWMTQCTLGYHWATQRILAGYTGTPLEKLSWNSPTLECHWRNLVESDPHWDATGETLTFAAYTGTPLEGLWQPAHALTHIVKHAE